MKHFDIPMDEALKLLKQSNFKLFIFRKEVCQAKWW